jgi:hypothetical protein
MSNEGAATQLRCWGMLKRTMLDGLCHWPGESETATTCGTGAQLTRSTALDIMMMMELLQ